MKSILKAVVLNAATMAAAASGMVLGFRGTWWLCNILFEKGKENASDNGKEEA